VCAGGPVGQIQIQPSSAKRGSLLNADVVLGKHPQVGADGTTLAGSAFADDFVVEPARVLVVIEAEIPDLRRREAVTFRHGE
jgi:hypothetical protein